MSILRIQFVKQYVNHLTITMYKNKLDGETYLENLNGKITYIIYYVGNENY